MCNTDTVTLCGILTQCFVLLIGHEHTITISFCGMKSMLVFHRSSCWCTQRGKRYCAGLTQALRDWVDGIPDASQCCSISRPASCWYCSGDESVQQDAAAGLRAAWAWLMSFVGCLDEAGVVFHYAHLTLLLANAQHVLRQELCLGHAACRLCLLTLLQNTDQRPPLSVKHAS